MLYVGIDAGGTKTEIRVASSQAAPEFSLHGAGANLQRSGLAASAKVLADLVLQATASFPASGRMSICAGVSGAGDPGSRQRLAAAVRDQLIQAGLEERLGAVQVVEDGLIALEAALGGGSGAVVIIGTGSAVLGRTYEGEMIRVGGWGYLLGDQGSGYAIGLAGLRLVAEALEGRARGAVPDQVCRQFDIRSRADLIRRVYLDRWAIQEVAPLIIQAASSGDPWALEVVEAQAEELVGQVAWMAEQAGAAIEPRLAFLGGLANDRFYIQTLGRVLGTRCPGWRVVPPVHEKPVAGAMRLARRAAS